MKLSKRINYIILPVLMIIFTLAGGGVFLTQKHMILKEIDNTLQYQTSYITDSMNTQLTELDTLSKQLLNSSQLIAYLSPERSQYSAYTIENQFVRFISNISINSAQKLELQIINMNKHSVFQFNAQNPFAKIDIDSTLTTMVDTIKKSFIDDDLVKLNATAYSIRKISPHLYQLNVFKIFSPEQAIYENMFSRDSRLFIARLSTKLNTKQTYLKPLHSTLDFDAQLTITPKTQLYYPTKKFHPVYRSLGHYSGEATSALGAIKLQFSHHYVNQQLVPYLIATISLVINLTLICFFLLKWLIKHQIIQPIETLNTQVQQAIEDNNQILNPRQADDEVSILNNTYAKLLEELNTLARRDPLTGLANRNIFNSALLRALDNSRKHSTLCALYYMNLDNFKSINDHCGHETGDQVLVEFSRRLITCLREEDIIVRPSLYSDVSRLAGDEFALVLSHISNIDMISDIGKHLVAIGEQEFNLGGTIHDVHVSIGIAVAPNDANDPEEMMKCADLAMSHVKKTGKNGYHFYSDKIAEELRRHSQIELALNDTLKHEDFYLVFMPIYSTQTGEIVSLECLIRAHNELLQNYGPDHYIPVAETTGLIKYIDLWVIKTALSHFKWLIDNLNYQGKLAINFSSWELRNDDFAPTVEGLIQSFNVPKERIELEITETCLVPNDSRVVERLSELKGIGIELALDDFGTGYTAFSQLQNYPVDNLKIDRSFIQVIGEQQPCKHRPLVDIILEIASLYNLTTVAEGVETQEQCQYVTALGCNQVQGYLLSKPRNWDDLIVAIRQHDPQSILAFCSPNSRLHSSE